mgnify:CR=1 FL=1
MALPAAFRALLRKMMPKQGVKHGIPEPPANAFFRNAEQNLRKELLSPQGYRRYANSVHKKYDSMGLPINTQKDLDWYIDAVNKKLKELYRAKHALRQGRKRFLADKRYTKGKKGLLTKVSGMSDDINPKTFDQYSGLPDTRSPNMKKAVPRDIDGQIRELEAELVSLNSQPLSYSQYIATVDDTLKNVPRRITSNKPGEYGSYGPVDPRSMPSTTAAGNAPSPLPFSKPGDRPFAVDRWGQVNVTKRGMEKSTMKGPNPMNTAVHELKHAVQGNLRANLNTKAFPLNYQKAFNKSIESRYFKKGVLDEWELAKNSPAIRQRSNAKLLGYERSEIAEELSARVSELRAMGDNVMELIIKDPKKFKGISNLDEIAYFTGWGKKLQDYLKYAWSLPPVAIGASKIAEGQ